ncbi:MAG: hypothetical protein IJR51_09300 [Clostridia bacterium]|nr:hypothetical protein [Clostridia bacterium]
MTGKPKQILMCSLLIAAVCLLAAGLADGGFTDVLRKAATICFECIGLG